jgi:hypothetical protein
VNQHLKENTSHHTRYFYIRDQMDILPTQDLGIDQNLGHTARRMRHVYQEVRWLLKRKMADI